MGCHTRIIVQIIEATFRPSEFTYTEVSSTNGSDANAGCTSVCRMTENNEKFGKCKSIAEHAQYLAVFSNKRTHQPADHAFVRLH